jgi:hypothetical protein
MTSNDLREKNKRMKRKQEKLAADNVDIFYCSGMSEILRKSFVVLIRRGGFASFLSSGTSRSIGEKRRLKEITGIK